ncbi:MAG: pyridoxamine 5'-phosphate oxidase [Thermoleophilia bacterium]|nr:pyridoxamine 5'-phosphate oxidase [Thermoleophilia bacterium]
MNDLPSMRISYEHGVLSPAAAGNDPMQLVNRWMGEAIAATPADDPAAPEPNAMALATATAAGVPSVRIVLCKGIDIERAAFVWYTNIAGRKAREVAANPLAAATFWWPVLQRQMRVAGTGARVDTEAAQRYFAARPRDSQLGSHASRNQSQPVASRADLEERSRTLAVEYEGGDVPMPEHWGGFELVAHELEFWQGRKGRLHDRILFTRCAPAVVPVSPPEIGAIVTDEAGESWHRMRLEP